MGPGDPTANGAQPLPPAVALRLVGGEESTGPLRTTGVSALVRLRVPASAGPSPAWERRAGSKSGQQDLETRWKLLTRP